MLKATARSIQLFLVVSFCTLPAAGTTVPADPDGEGEPASRSVGYLVIAAPPFTGSAGLSDLINLRISQGFDVTVVDTNTTGPGAQEIKNFIENAYHTWPVPPGYLLLVGDTDSIPCWTGSGSGGPPTDLYYASVDSHYLPEIACGRLPVRTTTELDALCSKIVARSGNTPHEAAFLAGEAGWQQNEATHDQVIAFYLDPAGWSSDRLYCHTYGATTSDVSAAFNDGRSIGCFLGHGSSTAWQDGPPFSQVDVRALTNTTFPFIVSIAALTGDFSMAECFGETWVRSSHGASAFLGASDLSYSTFGPYFETWLFDGCFGHGYRRIGEMVLHAQMQVYMSSMGTPQEKQAFIEMYNLLGDPAMELYTDSLPPVPDVKVNGTGGSLAVPVGTPVSITIGLDPGSCTGLPHDWWVWISCPSWSFWRTSQGWQPSLLPIRGHDGPLFSFADRPVGTSSSLPPGVYSISFAVDELNNVLEGTFIDTVELTVN